MISNPVITGIYILLSPFLFNLIESFKFYQISFFTTLILSIFFLSKRDRYFKIFYFLTSLSFIFFSYLSLSEYFFLSILLMFFLWFYFYFIKNPKILFLTHILSGFLLFFTISALKGINLLNFLISLHFSLPFALSFIKETLYFNDEPEFPYGHFIPFLFGITGVIFIILRIYGYLLFLPLFILLSISIYSTLSQPPYRKPYPLVYQIIIYLTMFLNYFSSNL